MGSLAHFYAVGLPTCSMVRLISIVVDIRFRKHMLGDNTTIDKIC